MVKLNGKPSLIDTTTEGGELWAMEVDPEEALSNFRKAIGQKKDGTVTSPNDNNGLLGGLKNELSNLMSQIYDPPPGTDEIVAMTEIIDYLEEGLILANGKKIKFDRIVLDTAPTGHTLRMLKLPMFLKDSVQKIQSLQVKMKSMSGMLGMLGGAMGNAINDMDTISSNEGNNDLSKLEAKMQKLDNILHQSKDAEFTIVSIPTELAAAETKRLLMSLQEDNIAVRRVIINQVIQQKTLENPNDYLTKIRLGQKSSIVELKNLANTNSVPLVLVPYFDTEVRTVYGLRIIGNYIFHLAEKN